MKKINSTAQEVIQKLLVGIEPIVQTTKIVCFLLNKDYSHSQRLFLVGMDQIVGIKMTANTVPSFHIHRKRHHYVYQLRFERLFLADMDQIVEIKMTANIVPSFRILRTRHRYVQQFRSQRLFLADMDRIVGINMTVNIVPNIHILLLALNEQLNIVSTWTMVLKSWFSWLFQIRTLLLKDNHPCLHINNV